MWADDTLTAFDLETTSADPETARVVTATILEIHVPTRSVQPFDWLANPGVDIPAEASDIHGITTEHARQQGQPAHEVVLEISGLLTAAAGRAVPVVIYNAPYDLTVLDRECRRHDLPTVNDRCEDSNAVLKVVDPLVIDRGIDRYRKGSRKLAAVCAHYDIRFSDADAHTSNGDALATARLAWKLARLYHELLGDLDDLQAQQAKWHAEWAASFEDYLRQCKAEDGASEEEIAAVSISRDWPMRPLAGVRL